MVYGPAGVGKTVLCATLPLPIVFISAEGGALSLREKNLFRIFTESLGMHPDIASDRVREIARCHSVSVRTGADLRSVYQQLQAYPGGYQSVAWDSVTETAQVMLGLLKTTLADGRARYGEMAESMMEFVRLFRDGLPGKHLCITAQEGSYKDDVTGVVMHGPDMPGKQLTVRSPYWMDETFYMGIWTDPEGKQAQQRYLLTQPNERYSAKDRSGVLDVMERPDLSAIIDKIRNS